MIFEPGATVVTAEGSSVGKVASVVVDPRVEEVSHIVVERGALLTEDKLVPVNLIQEGREDEIVLREDAGDLDQLPDYKQTHFIPLSKEEMERRKLEGTPAMFYTHPLDQPGSPFAEQIAMSTRPVFQVVEHELQNLPEDAVAVDRGARVYDIDGNQIGEVEEILTEPEGDVVSHIVISKGLLLKEKKLVPMDWVQEIEGDEIRLAVGGQFLEELKEYPTAA